MENNSSFNFKLVSNTFYTSKKDNSKMCRLVAYCSYGFIINLFTTEEKGRKLIEKAKIKNNDITEFIYIMYDNKINNFRYYLSIK